MSSVENVVIEGDLQDVMVPIPSVQRNYLEMKWGSLPNAKTQQAPFGEEGYRIDWGNRVFPYGASRDLPCTSGAKPTTMIDVTPSFFDEQLIKSEFSSVARHALSDSIVRAIFQSLLCREPDPPALSMYGEQLSRGSITTAILCDVVRSSDEYFNLHAADLTTRS